MNRSEVAVEQPEVTAYWQQWVVPAGESELKSDVDSSNDGGASEENHEILSGWKHVARWRVENSDARLYNRWLVKQT